MPYTPTDPRVGHQNTDTSAAAAASIAPRVKTIRAQVMHELRGQGPLTADEAADAIGRHYGSVRPRLSELRESGLIVDTGIRRDGRYGKSQIVWRLAMKSEVEA